MIKRVYAKLKSAGIGGLLKAICYRLFPYRLEYFQKCKNIFQTGHGLEIGGPSDIFRRLGSIPVYAIAKKIDNCNFGHQTVWEGSIHEGNNFIYNKRAAPGRQYVGEAGNLAFIGDASRDFVLSSHCIEHLANPLQGLAEWIRVLRQDGLLVLVVPHKDGTFDHRRPVSTLAHLISDFENHVGEGDMTHLAEILRLHDLGKDPGGGDFESFEERSKRNQENRCLHQHVFDTRLAVEVVHYMGLEILAVEVFAPCHIAIIARKSAHDHTANNQKYRGIGAAPSWRSPFRSDWV